MVTLQFYEGYEGVEITKVSNTKKKETTTVARLGSKEGGEVDLKSVLKTLNLSHYPNLKDIDIDSRFEGDYGGKPGKAWLGNIRVSYGAEGMRKDFQDVFGKLRKTKPERLTCDCNPGFVYKQSSFKSHIKSNRHRDWALENVFRTRT